MSETKNNTESQDKSQSRGSEYRVRISPLPTINVIWIHLTTLYGIYLIFSGQVGWKTLIFTWIYGLCGQIGAHAGAHRLWSHRAYKVKLPLKLLLVWWQTISGQNSAYEWARDHRGHHLYSETDADTYNASRGFFFAHIGWIMVRKHPDVIAKGKLLDLSDLESDPIVMFQHKYYKILTVLFTFNGPMLFPWYFWGESHHNCFVMVILRYVVSLHMTFLINSWAHLYGVRPYDKNISPTESMLVGLLSGGEGWHNFHHTYAFDYKASEYGTYRYNTSTLFIDTCAWLGLAYGRRTVPKEVIEKRMQRTGDGSDYRH